MSHALEDISSCAAVFRWFSEFKCDCISLIDDEPTGRPLRPWLTKRLARAKSSVGLQYYRRSSEDILAEHFDDASRPLLPNKRSSSLGATEFDGSSNTSIGKVATKEYSRRCDE